MAFSFDEIEELARRKFATRAFIEAALLYERLEQSAIDELGSDQSRGYCINNQAVCLFHAGKLYEAQARSAACIEFFKSKFAPNGYSGKDGSDVSRFDAVNWCFHSHMIISSNLPGYVHPWTEPPLESKLPYIIQCCGELEG